LALLAGAVLVLSASNAEAASPTDTLRRFFAQANRIVLSPDPDFLVAARRNIIRALAYDVFDFPRAAALALGPEWQARTPTEREEFIRLFADLLETGYIATIGSKASVHGGLTIDYVGETVHDDTATVRTVVLTPNGSDLPLEYQMARVGGRWLVRDVNIDGLSLIANYRAQFQRVMQGSSYEDLVARMRARAPDAPPLAPAASPTAAGAAPVVETAIVAAAPANIAPAEPSVIPVADIAQAPPGDGRFWVQVGAFRDDEAVVQVMERLSQHPVTLFNETESTGAGVRQAVARVLVGPFTKWTEADAKVRELQAGGFRPFIAIVRE
jgi:phospholipid transport system substrate-binding protein